MVLFFFFKIEGAVESLSREILTIQAKGDKEAAGLLLQKYSVITEPLKVGLKKLESVQVDHNSVNFCCDKMKNTHLVPDEALFWHLPITHSQNSQGLLMHL